MLRPIRVSAGRLTGRLVLFLVILAVLVAVDAYRDESALLSAQVRGLVPDRELVERLERGHEALVKFARDRERQVNERLRGLPAQGAAQLDARIAALRLEIAEKERRRRSATQKTVALLTGAGFQDDLENEVDIQLLTAERDVLVRLKDELAARTAALRDARERMLRAAGRTQDAWQRYSANREALARFERDNPFWVRIPGSDEWQRSTALRREMNDDAREYAAQGAEFYRARDRWRKAQALPARAVAQVHPSASPPRAARSRTGRAAPPVRSPPAPAAP